MSSRTAELFIPGRCAYRGSSVRRCGLPLRWRTKGFIPREEALMRVQPARLTELLHRQVDPAVKRGTVIGRGNCSPVPALPPGRSVFHANDRPSQRRTREKCILLRRETSPKDIRRIAMRPRRVGRNAAASPVHAAVNSGAAWAGRAVVWRGLYAYLIWSRG